MQLPSTFHSPNAFMRSLPCGFDGPLNWVWLLKGLPPDAKVSPSDIDCLMEHFGNFLIVESKAPGIGIPHGQWITLRRLHSMGCFSILCIWGKDCPIKAQYWKAQRWDGHFSHVDPIPTMADALTSLVAEWWEEASNDKIELPADHNIDNIFVP